MDDSNFILIEQMLEDSMKELQENPDILIAAVVNEDGTIGFEGDDLGNNHKFILTPYGEFYAWGKKQYDYGKGMLAIENEGASWDELDDFTRYEWQRDSSDTYEFYRNQGYATGTTSGGGFFMLNAPSGLNTEQVQAIESHFRDAGYKSIVIHESGTRNFFNRAKDALDWLSPRRNPEPEEKEYLNFFEGKPEKDLWKEGMAEKSGNLKLDVVIEEFLNHPIPDPSEDDYGDWDEEEENDLSVDLIINDLAYSDISIGKCVEVSEAFAVFANSKGLDARIQNTDNWPMNTGFQGIWETHNSEEGESHTWIEVSVDGEQYQVDFTASQFGYTEEFPSVFKLSDGSWQREFLNLFENKPEKDLWTDG